MNLQKRWLRLGQSTLAASCTVLVGAALSSASGCTDNITLTPPSDAGGDADAAKGATESDGGGRATSTLAADGPTLSALSVSPLALTPAFSPTIYDYTVRCAAGPNVVQIDATAGAGVSVGYGPVTTSSPTGSAEASVSVTLEEDAAAVIVASATSATGDSAQQQYWIRCLPHDFPALTVTLHPEIGAPTAGYYLTGNVYFAGGLSGFVMILDSQGTPIWYRRAAGGGTDLAAQGKNVVSYAAADESFYEVRDLASGASSRVASVGADTDHHDLRKLANGNWLTLSAPVTRGVDLSGQVGYETQTSILDCQLQEVDSSGNVVWQWLASDHFDPGKESTYAFMGTANGETALDTFHCNSMDVTASGDILMSARHLDAVFLISRATSKVVWKLGGTTSNKDGAQSLRTDGTPFYRQHDARFLANGDLTLFDDQTGMTGLARGVEYKLDVTTGVATSVFEYAGTTNSAAMGSFRREDDGESVVGWGIPGSGARAVTEINAAGQSVLDVEIAGGNYAYRAVKVPPTAFDLDVLRASAGAP